VMKPHLVKIIEDGGSKARTLTVPKESDRIKLKQENVDFIKQAMIGVAKEGTSARVFAGAGYVSAGKTGTAQVIAIKKNEKYDAKRTAEQHRDHSLYTAFAPADNPRIAIAIIVENGGFGAAAAAPIVRQALDYYLLGKKPESKDKDKPVVDKTDTATAPSAAEVKAQEESVGGPKAGGESHGNKD
jgi:penicillin-binding protein 2